MRGANARPAKPDGVFTPLVFCPECARFTPVIESRVVGNAGYWETESIPAKTEGSGLTRTSNPPGCQAAAQGGGGNKAAREGCLSLRRARL